MNNKKLAEMIKEIKAKKMSEQVAAMRTKTDREVGPMPGHGARHNPATSAHPHTKGAVEKRSWQYSGNQSRNTNDYVAEEDDKELGDTDTGKKAKKDTEVVNINPTMKDIAGGGLTTTKGLDRK